MAAERQHKRDRRNLLGRCLSPLAQPKPSAAPAARKNDEGARAGKQAAQGGGDETTQGRRRECDGLGLELRAAAAAAAATAAADVGGDGVDEGEARGSEELGLEHRVSTGAMDGWSEGEGCGWQSSRRFFFFFALANAVRADARAVLSNLDPQAHENFIASH